MSHRKKFTTKEHIQNLEADGVSFKYMSPADARYVLNRVNYYFQVNAYSDNFAKGGDGKFINLDFAYLADLAAIDRRLRQYLLALCLDVEQGIKTYIVNNVSNNSKEDGYTIVQDFRKRHPHSYAGTMEQVNKNRYLSKLYGKYRKSMPIWVFMTACSFGVLSLFVDFYADRYRTQKLKQIQAHLKFCKNIRNACAHSDPFLTNLFADEGVLRQPPAAVMSVGKEMGIPQTCIKDLKVNDLISTFYLHQKVQSAELAQYRVQEGRQLLDRINSHQDWYEGNSKLQTFWSVLKQLIDYLAQAS